MPCVDAEQLVVEPLDFASAQKQLQLQDRQTHMSARNTMNKEGRCLGVCFSFSLMSLCLGDSHAASFLDGVNSMRQRDLLALDLQSRLASHEYSAPDRQVASTSTFSGTNPVAIASSVSSCSTLNSSD